MTVSAPRFLNGLTALANATTNCFPIILISGSSDRAIADLEQGGYEELDQRNAAKPYTKAAYRINRPQDIGIGIARAIRAAVSGRPGGVYLDLTAEVLGSTLDLQTAKNSLVSVVEAGELGTMMAGLTKSVAAHGYPIPAPAILLSGRETAVKIGSSRVGRGGRNTEFLLGLALGLTREPNIWAIAGDSDGIDGTEDAAGAFVTPDTLARAANAGLDPRKYLSDHDSYTFFELLGDLVRTGPTFTNVNDMRALLISQ